MYSKCIFVLFFFIVILWSISMAFSNTTNKKIIISNSYAMAICTIIVDLELQYNTQEKMNKRDFKKYFMNNFGDIELQDSSEGIWVYLNPSEPQTLGGDAMYLVDNEKYNIIKRIHME